MSVLRADWTVSIGGVDVSQRVQAGGTIDHGKPSVFADFQAPRAVFDILTHSVPVGTDIGAEVIIHVTVDGITQHRRFTGMVQAFDVGYLTTRVTAVHKIADLALRLGNSVYPGNPPLPPQLDRDRVDWLTPPDVTINIVGTQGRYVVGVSDTDPTPNLLDALLTMAEDCDASLRGTRLGDIDYRLRVWPKPNRYTVPSGITEADSIDMTKERGFIVNVVNVGYGPFDPATQTQRTVEVRDDASVLKHGERTERLTTVLANKPGAEGHAADYLISHGELWHAPDVTLVMSLATVAQVAEVCALDDGSPVRVAPLPDGYPIRLLDTEVIGVTDVMHETDWRIVLHLAPGTPVSSEDDGNWVPDGSITGGDETGVYVKNGQTWRWHRFLNDGTLTVAPDTFVVARGLLAAGGGAGGYIIGEVGGAGGGGGVWEGDVELVPGQHPVVVGAGAVSTNSARGPNGQDSTFLGITVKGGGGGTTLDNPIIAGSDGGSGGAPYGQAVPGTGAPGGAVDGFHGGDGLANGDGGGGSGTSRAGWPSDITGVVVEYGPGGPRGGTTTPRPPIDGANGVGGGGEGGMYGGAGDGGKGGVVVAYRIQGNAPTGTPYDDPATGYDAATTPYLGG